MAEDSGDVLDSWEDQVDSGILDERLKKISVSCSDSAESTQKQAVMLSEDTGRTEYRPQVRILKREPNTNHNNVGNAKKNANSKKPMKTLEQREAEYAEARMRIFGAAAEAQLESDPNSNVGDSASADNCVDTATETQYRIGSTPESRPVNVNVIRQPKGPDGSSGFSFER